MPTFGHTITATQTGAGKLTVTVEASGAAAEPSGHATISVLDNSSPMLPPTQVTIPDADFPLDSGDTLDVDVSGLANGSYTVYLQDSDGWGNMAASIQATITDWVVPPSVTITHKSTSSADNAIVEITGSVSKLVFVRQNGVRVSLVNGNHYTYSGTTYSIQGGIFWSAANYDHLEAEFSDGTVISFDPKEEPVVFTASLATKVGISNVGFTATATTGGAGDANVRVRLYTDSARTSFLWETVVSNLTDGGNVSFYLPYSGGAETLAPGTTYYTSLVDNDSGGALDTGQFTVPHYTTKVFKEWRKDGAKFDFLTPITQDITLVGAWDEVYRVTFADYDGTVLKTQDVVDGSDQGLVMPADPSRDGYTFAGWVCSLDGHIWDASNDEVISEMTLKASYTQN